MRRSITVCLAGATIACGLATAGCSAGAGAVPIDAATELSDARALLSSLAASGVIPAAPLSVAQALLAVLTAFTEPHPAANAAALPLIPELDVAGRAVREAASEAGGTATRIAAQATQRALDAVRAEADAASIAVARDAVDRLLLTFLAATEGALHPEAAG